MNDKTPLEKIFSVLIYLILFLLSAVCLYPLLYILFSSLSNPDLLMKNEGLILYPRGFSLEGYKMVFKNPNILSGFANTFFYVIFGTAINMLATSVGAYVLSREGLRLNGFFLKLITFTMFFSGGLIPTFMLVDSLGLYNTPWAVILPGAINVVNLFILRTSFAGIPKSLIESAKIDGAGDGVVLFKIVIPLSKASMAVISLYYIVAHWNSWFAPSIYLKDRELYPIQLILREILIQNQTSSMMGFGGSVNYGNAVNYQMLIQYAAIIVATLPILCIYPLLQRYFVNGVMLGSIKE